ncbi:MAG TPA: c-type cytochrome domain-containing protein [Fimbriimonadaceae bacterium]|jgi:cytochrome c553
MNLIKQKPLTLAISSLVLISSFAFNFGQAAAVPAAPKVKFDAVKKVLDAKCISCHNDKRHPGGVDLSSFDSVMKGGQHGVIVIAGKPDKSDLVQYVNGKKTPRMPMRQAALSDKDIATISDWVKGGAKK